MITVLTGDNSFEIRRTLDELSSVSDIVPEHIDGSALELKQLPDLLMGGTLFATKRTVIIKDLSQNSAVWEKLPEWIERISEDIQVILVESKLDKRTTTYKELKKKADVREFTVWSERDWATADAWVLREAKSRGVELDKKSAHHLVERVGLDQWQLASAIEKLSFLDVVSLEAIDEVIDPRPSENVFQLFELALAGERQRIHEMLRTLELTEEPYRLFALLSSQAFQLVAISAAEASDDPSKDFGIHPYVAGKLSRYAKKLGPRGVRRVAEVFADTDADMKLSRGEPWLLIERTLAQI